MKHYLFWIEDENSEDDGLEILVGANSLLEACTMFETEFPEVNYGCAPEPLSEWEAENSGLDEI